MASERDHLLRASRSGRRCTLFAEESSGRGWVSERDVERRLDDCVLHQRRELYTEHNLNELINGKHGQYRDG